MRKEDTETKAMDKERPTPLDQRLAEKLASRRQRNQLRTLTLAAPGAVDFSSNAYLSLPAHPRVGRAYLDRLHRRFANNLPVLGSGGSRLLDGNSALAERLEADIARFHEAPAGLLFNSAMDANVGLFGSVPQPGDVVVYDERVHASVHDGLRLSRAGRRVAFRHNDVASLEASLQAILAQARADGRSTPPHVFVAVEGVYSMDGDMAPLAAMADCIETRLPPGHGHLIVDEAHSVGVYGPQGRGLVCALGLGGRVWARVLGFGKALGCSGGMVLCSPTTRDYLVNYARTLIYTTAMGYPALAGIETAYEFLRDDGGEADRLLARVHELTRHAHAVLAETIRRSAPPASLLRVQEQPPVSPILPLITSEPRSLARHCQRRGFVVRPIVAPTVPRHQERVRVCVHAGNTVEQIDGLARAVEEWLVLQKENGTGPSAANPADTEAMPSHKL